jgi:uncharacterized protein YjgD (DUF1641 family)
LEGISRCALQGFKPRDGRREGCLAVSEVESPSGIEKLASLLEDPKSAEVMAKLIELAVKLEEAGVLDVIGALADEKALRSLADFFLSSGALHLLDNMDNLIDMVSKMVEAMSRPAEPVGLGGLLRALGDPDVQRGLGRLLALLKALGRA